MHFWLADAYDRILPESPAGELQPTCHIAGAARQRRCRVSSACMPSDGVSAVAACIVDRPACRTRVRVRLADFVPVLPPHRQHARRHGRRSTCPAFMPDPLVDAGQGTWMGVRHRRAACGCQSICPTTMQLAARRQHSSVSFSLARPEGPDVGTIRCRASGRSICPPLDLPDHQLVLHGRDRRPLRRRAHSAIGTGSSSKASCATWSPTIRRAVYVPLITPPLDSPKPDLQLLTITREGGRRCVAIRLLTRCEQWLDLGAGGRLQVFRDRSPVHAVGCGLRAAHPCRARRQPPNRSCPQRHLRYVRRPTAYSCRNSCRNCST